MPTVMKWPVMLTLLVLTTCAYIAIYPSLDPPEHLGVGVLLGSAFGHSMLASGWTVLGPGSLLRWPIALLWLMAIPCAWIIHTAIYPNHAAMTVVWFSQGAIFLLVQTIAWPLRLWFGMRVCKPASEAEDPSQPPASHQFGIQHLLIVTTIVAIAIASGRVLLPIIADRLNDLHEAGIFSFLLVAACLMCIPFSFAILALRRPLAPTLILLFLAGLATFKELPLLIQLGLQAGGPDGLHIALINVFSLLPILVVSSGLRRAGYQLVRRV